jgi:ankyrin repeat protein
MTSIEALFEAVKAKDRSAVDALLTREPSLLDARDVKGLSPLLVAVYHRADEIVELIRSRGAELDIHEASAVGDADRIRALLEIDPSLVDVYSADGSTPLHLACFFGQVAAADLLVDRGANVGAWSANYLRNQPLHAAIAGARDHRIISRLLNAGADVNAVGGAGYTPLHLAGSRGDLEVIEWLATRRAISRLTDSGQTPAEVAAEHGHAEAAERLGSVAVGE